MLVGSVLRVSDKDLASKGGLVEGRGGVYTPKINVWNEWDGDGQMDKKTIEWMN